MKKLFSALGREVKNVESFLKYANATRQRYVDATFVRQASVWRHDIQPKVYWVQPGNTKGGSITVQLTSCLTGLESAL